jgi:hypothetical protein
MSAFKTTRRPAGGRPRRGHAVDAGLVAILVAACASSPSPATPEAVVYIDLVRPTVVVFLPTSLRQSVDADAAPLEQKVAAALERARLCLGADYAAYRTVVADRIVVRSGDRQESFEIATAAPLVGALLLQPEANPRIVFAGGGPDALRRMLPRAVRDYFDRKCDG